MNKKILEILEDFIYWLGIAIVVIAIAFGTWLSGTETKESKARAEFIESCRKIMESRREPTPELCNNIFVKEKM